MAVYVVESKWQQEVHQMIESNVAKDRFPSKKANGERLRG